MVNLQIHYAANGDSEICAPILYALPDWFGIPQANQHYIDYVATHPTFVARIDDNAAGFLSLAQPFPHAAEIHVMAVHPHFHRQGIGRALVSAAEDHLRREGARFLQVKTMSDKHPSPEYALTRAFYFGVGFVALEEFPTLWGEHDPCLQLIKAL